MNLTIEQITQRFKKALSKDGDFPASARVIAELQKLANDPSSTAQQMTDIILKEPSLGTRILGIVNSAYFRRVKPVLTVSEAVIVLGSRQIADICASLLILNKFSSNANDNLKLALQKCVFTGLVTSGFQENSCHELGFLLGVFRNLGEVMLFYYFPEVGMKLKQISNSKNISFEDSFRLIFQKDLIEVVVDVFDVLNLPKYYRDTLKATQLIINPRTTMTVSPQIVEKAKYLELSEEIARNVVEGKELDLMTLPDKYQGVQYNQIVKSVELAFSSLDKFEEVANLDFSNVRLHKTKYIPESGSHFSKNEQLLEPLKQAISRNATTATLLILATDILKSTFNRVILYLKAKDQPVLKIRIFEGNQKGFDESNTEVPLTEEHILTDCLKIAKPTFPPHGLFPDSYPVACIPVGNIKVPVAVLYFDRRESVESCLEITDREKDLIQKLHLLINQSLKSAS
ncbi:MAG: HDOD domain-containing protein [Deltaproteobacteria bacterium]|nr:HDOD domain-containing protein [Deltaproteobacteria bacterium]MCX7952374.1 HDOD domain-containing protein [Deltaproteobacteria bacterium]